MFIKNNILYFDEYNNIYFDKFKFNKFIHDGYYVDYFNKYKTTLPGYSSYELSFGLRRSDIDDFEIYVDISNLHKSDNQFKLFDHDDIQFNKRSFISVMKKVTNILYNGLLAIKKYNLKSDLCNVNLFVNDGLLNNLVYVNENSLTSSISLYNTFDYNSIVVVYDNMISKKCNNCTFSIQDNELHIENNNGDKTIFFYPKSFKSHYKKTINIDCPIYILGYSLYFTRDSRKFIVKHDDNIYIDYQTPEHILTNFFDNINVFQDISNFSIKDKYDILKYL